MKKLLLFFALLGLVAQLFGQTPAEPWRNKIALEVLAALDRGETADVLVVFSETADLRRSNSLNSKSDKARFVFTQLQETAARSQETALRILAEQGFSGNTLFLVNALAIEKANTALLQKLSQLPEIEAITADPWMEFQGPVAGPA
ncbi:MAG: hypothetical protein Q7U74_02015, partial [Saprospiraceae bacterium]|nr:hypothetical protein [Saprospiraceae bacterium]